MNDQHVPTRGFIYSFNLGHALDMDISLSQIPNAIEQRESLPRPNWATIAEWVDERFGLGPNSSEQDIAGLDKDRYDQAWNKIARDWLEILTDALPAEYVVYESANFLSVLPKSSHAERMLAYCQRSRSVILETLQGVAKDDGLGKHVVLAFETVEQYYDYISDFYPDEGDFALSGGVFLDTGYGHFAICMAYGQDHERVIAHELNHALLRHLPLPLWLNEGVTQVMEDTVVGSSYFGVDHERVRRHRAYWNDETIDAFWSGDSFHSPDEGQELSYHLAETLFRNLMSDHPKQILHLLSKADFGDAGNAACVDACDETLADRVSQFLGQGPWDPRCDYDDAETS